MFTNNQGKVHRNRMVAYTRKGSVGCFQLMKTELNNAVLHPTNMVVIKLKQLLQQIAAV